MNIRHEGEIRLRISREEHQKLSQGERIIQSFNFGPFIQLNVVLTKSEALYSSIQFVGNSLNATITHNDFLALSKAEIQKEGIYIEPIFIQLDMKKKF